MRWKVGDIFIFSISTGITWAFGGMFTAIVFYYNPTGVPTITPTLAHHIVLGKIIATWGVCGFVLGCVALFNFISLESRMGPINAFPVHLMHMSLIALVVGALLGVILYGVVDPPPGAMVRSLAWRIPVSCVTGLVTMHMAIKIISKIGRLVRFIEEKEVNNTYDVFFAGCCRITLPSGWRPAGLLRRFLTGGHIEFFGPQGSSIKFAIGPIWPEPTVEERKHNLARLASKYGHRVLSTGEIEVAGKKHATMTCEVPGVGILKHYSLIFNGIEYLATAKGDLTVCDSIVKTFRCI